MERDVFLARVADAVMSGGLPDVPDSGSGLPELDPTDLVSLFRSRAMSVNAVVHGPTSRHGVPRVVAGIAAGHGAATFVAWDDLNVAGVPSTLVSAGLTRVTGGVVPNGPGTPGLLRGHHHLDLGVTGADAGLAESGSIVLVHTAGRPRMASLAPEVHIALLDVGVIERSLAHWSQRHPGLPADTANLVVITGPSRTGDIEMQLNLGVHGPRHLHVVLVS